MKGMIMPAVDGRQTCVIDLYEKLLLQRAFAGLRPVLYVSSFTDLECAVTMLMPEVAATTNYTAAQAAPMQASC